MRLHLLFTAVLFLGFGSAALGEVTPQQKAAAKTRLDRGMKAFGEKKYDEAMKELRQGFALTNAPDFLYAMGQVERLRGNCQAALMHYQAFLDTEPGADQSAATKVQIDRCEKLLKPVEAKVEPAPAPAPVPAPVLAPAPVAPVAVVTPNPAPPPALEVKAAPPEPRRWYQDPLGGVLLAGGVVGVAGGLTSYSIGRSAVSSSKTSLESYQRARDLSWTQPVGVGAMGVGGALIVGAVVRYVLAGSPEAPVVSLSGGPGGGSLVVQGRF